MSGTLSSLSSEGKTEGLGFDPIALGINRADLAYLGKRYRAEGRAVRRGNKDRRDFDHASRLYDLVEMIVLRGEGRL